ncbi:MAG: CocE/NonD family hydrolase [Aquabacterium sp.]|nr:MAG: CocE/NonD family hydrolase [Aquabacterium sp.]
MAAGDNGMRGIASYDRAPSTLAGRTQVPGRACRFRFIDTTRRPPMPVPSKLRRTGAQAFVPRALVAALSLALAAPSFAQTTTMGTRGSTTQPLTTITTNAGSTWKTYTRAADYPKAVTLPVQFITMANGKKLAVLLTVPADADGKPVAGTFPSILTQTAYRIDLGWALGTVVTPGNTLVIGGQDTEIVKRGYVGVAVDVVGSGISEGEAKLLGAEEQAGYAEAVEWVARQPWSDGKIGLAGTSYLGITSLLTARQQHPAVKAVFAQVPMGDSYRGTVGTGGLLNAKFISVWLTLTQSLSVQNDIARLVNPTLGSYIDGVTKEHIAAIDSWYLPTVDNGIKGVPGIATDDGDFWAVRSPIEGASKINVPTFIVGASADIFQRDEPLLYEQLKNRVNTKLVIYPGAHVQAVAASLFGANDAIHRGPPNSPALMLQWFDHYLKGIPTGVEALPNVTQFVEGYGLLGMSRFSRATDWPHPQASPQRLYLRGNLRLSADAPTRVEPIRTVKEPKAPVITYAKSDSGKTVSATVKVNDGSDCSISIVQWTLGIEGLLPKSCYSNNATVEKTQGAIVYETEMLKQDLYINGPIQADIWLSSSRTEAAVSVRVDDVDLFGKATPITGGLQSAAYRAVDETRSRYLKGVMIQPWHPFTVASRLPVVPDIPVLVPVEVFPAAALIRKGHKLRIAISASNQAQGVWPLPSQALADGGVTTIHSDPSHPSSIVLPVVPAGELN